MALLFLTLPFIARTVTATREDLIAGIERFNSDVIELRNEIESSISNRCNSIRGCYKSSYEECQSEYTNQQKCPLLEELGYAIAECGAGKLCNGLFDDTITTVRLPASVATGANGNPTNPEVVEAICYTRTAERWMVKKFNQDKELWKSLGTASPHMFFGSYTGVFRIFPARHSRECGQYDPRLRPWYQASVPSTISNEVKPRNVVILMDTSRSMNSIMNEKTKETKLSYMKKAVASTVEALSNKASIAVIRFGERPDLVGRSGSSNPFMWRQATASHKESLIEGINAMDVQGRSNWVAAFEFAFKLIKNSLLQIEVVDEDACKLENIALLFFSDGKYNLPAGVTDEKIVDLVSSRVEQVEAMGDFHVHSFLYSIGTTDALLKQIACTVDGLWSPVTSSIAPRNVTSGYQAYFSVPMGTDAFRNYTDWSEPYTFSSSGELGYTVSSLVYNRDVAPPQFMGVVGMDIGAEAARRLYGGTMEETVLVMNEIIEENKVRNFNATCEQQKIDLTYCETQSMRYLNGGLEAICVPNQVELTTEEVEDLLSADLLSARDADTDIVLNVTDKNVTAEITGKLVLGPTETDVPTELEVKEAIFDSLLNCSKGAIAPCAGYDEYPDDMWRNINLQGKTYHDRVCCEVGTNMLSDDCPKLDEIRDTKISDSAIFAIMFGSLLFVELIGCFYCFHYRKRRERINAE